MLTIVLLMITGLAFGQAQPKKSVIHLLSSERSEGIKRDGRDIIKVYKGIFQQDYSKLMSDSAYFYPRENAFDAFGHVDINQGDTLNVYSDKLNYNGNTKIALLTDHVRLVDKDATLTTNYLTYNTATRQGTYTGGGKLVNKTNTLTSQNGYYYAFLHDSYFRYNVVLVTNDALIKTDTLRYNTTSRISYFYGPTNIYGTTGKPGSRDTLYTENGLYNTVLEQAKFGKNNLYHQGTKSLKGDSLFYDKLKGYGRAVKNVTFSDTEQKMTLKGNLGTYYKADERTQVTENAYAVILTEEKDTTSSDSAKSKIAADSVKAKAAVSASKTVAKKGSDTTNNKVNAATLKRLGLDKKTIPAATIKTDSLTSKVPASTLKQLGLDKKNIPPVIKTDTINAGKALATAGKLVPPNGLPPNVLPPADKNSKPKKGKDKNAPAPIVVDSTKLKPVQKMKVDSIFMSADTLETRMMTYKDQKILEEQMRIAGKRDTSIKVKKVIKKPVNPKLLVPVTPAMTFERVDYHPKFFGNAKPPAPKVKKPLTAAERKRFETDSIRRAHFVDSVTMSRPTVLNDTTRVRILVAYHNAKLFKSDLQAKSDSLFYSTSDSTIRCFVDPIIWTQGSQLSGDTVLLQLKNKKFDNLLMFPKAFIVNVDKKDSATYNQVGGKKMRGFFKDDKLERVFVDGNSEDIYFTKDSVTNKVTEMVRSIATRIRVNFKDKNEASNVTYLTKTEHHYTPITKVKDEDKTLKGFIWKPKERPASKDAVINAWKYRQAAAKAAAKNPPAKGAAAKGAAAGKQATGKPADLKPTTAAKDSTGKALPVTLKSDSTNAKPPVIRPDTVINGHTVGKPDTLKRSGLLVKPDTTAKKPVTKPDTTKKP